ncbi:DnaJ domain-containing protein [uncultured Lamprocystis sp.]|jgi:curved DNA-binding protein CbpA|uniref:DnaJ domain-containing protein n=1 Tax=uncultured Lamprocystis sp. TaxID=543132 RepID=UPI0025D9CD3A|nr:DnaJ domain-containing protein [uncultured Lamprocystis sp.]
MKTLYDVLEVSRWASKETITAAYQGLLRKYQQEAGFACGDGAEINARIDAVKRAYTVLVDPDKRQDYDKRLGEGAITEPVLNRRNQAMDSVPSNLMKYVLTAMAFSLPVAAAIYIALHGAITSERVATQKTTDQSERMVKIEEAAQERRLELENEHLRQQIEVLKSEQTRRAKEVDYTARERDRLLRIEESRQAVAEREIQSDRTLIDRASNRQYNNQLSQDVVDDVNRTVELNKDAAAARLGVTRQQYDSLEREKWNETSGWR